MPAGIQVYGPDGSLWVDISTRLGRMYGGQNFGPGNVVLQQLAVLNNQGTSFAIAPDPQIQTNSSGAMTINSPVVGALSFGTASGNVAINVNYTFANYSNPYTFVYYGAY